MKCHRCGEGCGCERAVRVPADRIIAVFAESVRMPEKDLIGRKRTEYLSQLRHLCVYLTYALSGLGFMRLESFWKRDHSTLVHSCQMAKKIIAKHPGMAEIVRSVNERLTRLAA